MLSCKLGDSKTLKYLDYAYGLALFSDKLRYAEILLHLLEEVSVTIAL